MPMVKSFLALNRLYCFICLSICQAIIINYINSVDFDLRLTYFCLILQMYFHFKYEFIYRVKSKHVLLQNSPKVLRKS